MDSSTLRQVQLVQLEILKEVDSLCKKHDINYWLAGGTQLGAVRHNGFIPWDDDLDIAMLRDDYERFINVAQKELDERYFVQTWDTDPFFALPITKIRKKGTLFVEAGSCKSKLNQGIFIDVFPYDAWCENEMEREHRAKLMYLYYKLLLVKSKYSPWLNGGSFNIKKWLAYTPVRAISVIIPKETMKKKYFKLQTAERQNVNSEYVFGSGEPQNIRSPMRRVVVEKLVLHQFEDMQAPIPCNFDEYLSKAYGDYMKLPPEDKRGNWHTVSRVEF